jgi:hypothetical protein
MMCFASFFFESTDIGGRLSVTYTLVLTSVAFKFVVSGSLPQIPYQTWLDIYVLTSFVILFLIALENVLVAVIAGRYGHTEVFPAFDNVSFLILGGFWIVCHLIAAVLVGGRWNKLWLPWDQLKSTF